MKNQMKGKGREGAMTKILLKLQKQCIWRRNNLDDVQYKPKVSVNLIRDNSGDKI